MQYVSLEDNTLDLQTGSRVFSNFIFDYLFKYKVYLFQSIVVICIGTDRSTGDSLGPLTGHILSSMDNEFHLYGTLDKPVGASDLEETIEIINANHPGAFIIAIDACLGKSENIGHVRIEDGPIHPGSGVNKKLPPVGCIHIIGIVNVAGYMEYLVLQNTRLNIVMKMANIIAPALNSAISRYNLLISKTAV